MSRPGRGDRVAADDVAAEEAGCGADLDHGAQPSSPVTLSASRNAFCRSL